MRLFKVKIKTEYILEMEVTAANEEEAEELAMSGYERSLDETMVDIETLDVSEVENER